MVWNPFARVQKPAAQAAAPVLSPSMPPTGIAMPYHQPPMGIPTPGMMGQQTSPPAGMMVRQTSPSAVPGLLPGLRPTPQLAARQPVQAPMPMQPAQALMPPVNVQTYAPPQFQQPAPNDGVYVDIPVGPPPEVPRRAVVEPLRGRGSVAQESFRGRIVQETTAPVEAYVPPPWKTTARPTADRAVQMPRNPERPILGGRYIPYATGGTRSSNPFKALEEGALWMASSHDDGMPPNVFQATHKINVPPHERPSLAHPLSLADTPDPPNLAPGHQALENVPPFDPKWLDPQPILDFFSGMTAPFAPTNQQIRHQLPSHEMGSEVGLRLVRADRETEQYRVSEVVPGGAAAEAGSVEAGDVLLSVNGSSVRGLDAHAVEDLLRGPAGTQAVLMLQKHKNSSNTYTVLLNRRLPDGSRAPAPLTISDVYDPVAMNKENRQLKESFPPGSFPPPPRTSGGLHQYTPRDVVPKDLRIQVWIQSQPCFWLPSCLRPAFACYLADKCLALLFG